jgi:SPX domain protein involved in polyphosphate accumulation
MKFGQTLRKTVYPPWKGQYINYDKLKHLLKEDSSADDDDEWTERDESAFVEELVNVQLEKVHEFQASTWKRLQDETKECETLLEPLGVKAQEEHGSESGISEAKRKELLQDVLQKLNKITKETNELGKYSRINYTGFLKAAKKHDRKRGQSYRVGPLLRVRLNALPFNSEDYSPLLYRLSILYSFARQSLEGKDLALEDNQLAGTEKYTAYKFWVHPDNLLEVKTIILRRLPVLVYNPQTSKIADGSQPDPTVTSLYFDNSKFSLYSQKLDSDADASSLRLRWYGQLSEQSEIMIEKKVVNKEGESSEQRFPIKSKYVMPFIEGDYKMDRSINKVVERFGEDSPRVADFKSAVEDIQSFIKTQKVEPMLRANYARTAFEIPGDDRIRISLDTNLAFIREDALDRGRPCRDPSSWHRQDIDDMELEYPFTSINKGEVSLFPFAVLEIKVRAGKHYEWVEDLMSSHLVKECRRFSKFIQGTANLFEDYVNSFPFWIGLVDTDIQTDPQTAFQDEQDRKANIAAADLVVGSLFGAKASPSYRSGRLFGSPVGVSGKSPLPDTSFPKATANMTRTEEALGKGKQPATAVKEDNSDDELEDMPEQAPSGLRSLFPSFSNSKYAQRHRPLPPGVTKPTYWIKDQGPLRVEAKVWLANQRTFIKWQHITVLLASLSLGLYNAAGANNQIARLLAVIYTGFAVFAGCWGYGVYMWRSNLISKRSPKDFDAPIGPLVVCSGLAVALVLNFVLKVNGIQSGDAS